MTRESDATGADEFAVLAGLPAPIQLADWRRRVNDLYCDIRRMRDPREAWARWRTRRNQLFRHHPQSPLDAEYRAGFDELPVFAYDPRWRLEVGLDGCDEAPSHEGDIGADGHIRFTAAATTEGLKARLGVELHLYWIESYGGGVFLPFRDGTAGASTYGAGRYLFDGIKGADLGFGSSGRMILDFNFSYHPSCVHSPDWVCPLAPRENSFAAQICAGERLSAS